MTLPGFFEGTGMPDPDWWQALWPDPARVLAEAGLAAGMRAIDLCAGDGWFTLPEVVGTRRVSRTGRDSTQRWPLVLGGLIPTLTFIITRYELHD